MREGEVGGAARARLTEVGHLGERKGARGKPCRRVKVAAPPLKARKLARADVPTRRLNIRVSAKTEGVRVLGGHTGISAFAFRVTNRCCTTGVASHVNHFRVGQSRLAPGQLEICRQ